MLALVTHITHSIHIRTTTEPAETQHIMQMTIEQFQSRALQRLRRAVADLDMTDLSLVPDASNFDKEIAQLIRSTFNDLQNVLNQMVVTITNNPTTNTPKSWTQQSPSA